MIKTNLIQMYELEYLQTSWHSSRTTAGRKVKRKEMKNGIKASGVGDSLVTEWTVKEG